MTKFSWFSFKKDVPSYTAKGIEITTRKNRIRIGVIINTKPHPLYKISTHLIRTWKLHIETRRRHKTPKITGRRSRSRGLTCYA